MLGEDNVAQGLGKSKIDDNILNILKGNIKAEDAIKEDQMDKVGKIFDDNVSSFGEDSVDSG